MATQPSIFRDPDLQRQFDVSGYVVVRFFDANEVTALKKLYRKYYDGSPIQGFHTLINIKAPETRRQIYQDIAAAYRPQLAQYLIDYEPFIASFAIKEPGDSGRIPLHLDWSVVDEREHISLNNWGPLTDTNIDNGCLCMLKGSHLHEFSYRGSNINFIAVESPARNIMQEMVARYPIRPLRMQAGEMVLYSHKMAHFSMPNRSQTTRVATSLVAIPRGAQPVHYHLNPDGSITRFKSGREFYLHHQHGDLPRHGLTEPQTISPERIGCVEDQVSALIELDDKTRAAWRA
ncbi:MAG: phytanoyl-CoA dioxygenase family protein [Bacteroidota bacterium]